MFDIPNPKNDVLEFVMYIVVGNNNLQGFYLELLIVTFFNWRSGYITLYNEVQAKRTNNHFFWS
jgi:hypothetical protein